MYDWDWFHGKWFNWEWILSSYTDLIMVAISAVIIYATLILFTRLNGLRSFSKMSSFDFAITVAFGSLIASTLLSKKPPLLDGIMGLAVLFIVHRIISHARRHSDTIEAMMGNRPTLLMAGSEVIQKNLDRTRVTDEDLKARLREAGVTHANQVLAAIMESTGEVSVMKRGEKVDFQLFENVRDAERLQQFSEESEDYQSPQTQKGS